jgi:hypothetical protein
VSSSADRRKGKALSNFEVSMHGQVLQAMATCQGVSGDGVVSGIILVSLDLSSMFSHAIFVSAKLKPLRAGYTVGFGQ